MVFSVAAQLKYTQDDMQKLNLELVDKLKQASRYEDAADLMDAVSQFDDCLDCYLKANNFEKAIKICIQTNH